ncbi:MAG: 2-oxoacid:acceptor oxidoreductase subunit alpha, partial [Gammaproteobacteria bacterium]|nr:2-oxoacid:acceptor oxidoreductase subunit alpha [Gammaproteobacteria bacterium]
LQEQNINVNYCRVKAFPFHESIAEFIAKHEVVYVVEQNRDAQLRTLLIMDSEADPQTLVSLLHYHGTPIDAGFVVEGVRAEISKGRAA